MRRKAQRLEHPARQHAYLAPLVLDAFAELDIMVSLWERGSWRQVCQRPEGHGLLRFEHQHGAAIDRFAYNREKLALACRRRSTVLGRHAGFADLFVPVPVQGRIESVLVIGPFRTERPSAADVLETWFALTGRQAHLSDPEFTEYLERTLSTLALEGPQLAKFERLLECLAELMAGRDSAEGLFAEVESLRGELALSRSVERMWRGAGRMVNELDSLAWASPHLVSQLAPLGLSRFPSQVLVGLFSSRPGDGHPIDDRLRRDDFQRLCVALARKAGNVASGQVADHGVTFLAASTSPTSRLQTRRKLLELGQEAAIHGRRRFGFSLHLGLGAAESPLSRQYQEALGAAQHALASGVRLATAPQRSTASHDLARLRRALIRPIDEKPDALRLRFDRFLDEVSSQAGHRLDVAKLCVGAGFERAVETVLGPGALGTATFSALEADVERALDKATTTGEVISIFRRSLDDVLAAAARPVSAQRDRSVRRAEEYMRHHCTEQLTLARVAQVAGFAPTYFSPLFRKWHGTTFERYLTQLRVERAMHLLLNTSLNLQRVAQLSGFSNRHHFGAMFKRHTGETPGHYRARDRRLQEPDESSVVSPISRRTDARTTARRTSRGRATTSRR